MTVDELHEALARPGRASLPYIDPHSPERPLLLECYRAPGHCPDSPVVLVQHGMGRNGDEYCEAWISAADRHGLLIVAPTFSKEAWPEPLHYNDGYVLAEDGTVRPRDTWSQAIPGRVFGMLREAGVTTRSQAMLWGHSAGGQFVHRLMSTQPHALYEKAGAANAGWYTLPTLEQQYPEGLGGIGLTQDDVKALLTYPLVIFAGNQDLQAENLPNHPAAAAQGPTRFARAHFYLERGRAEAARLGVPCHWRIIVVPGVGHEGMLMAAVAAAYWFDGELPQAPAKPRTVEVQL